MNLLDTIAAISTPFGKGGVAMIRISGRDAKAVASRVFHPANKTSFEEALPSRAVYGRIVEEGREIDDGIAVFFKAPHSFTGEDTAEISCHGGLLITQKVLAAILRAGARPAEAGEFTRRAFILGKLDLSRAEALADLLEAKSDAQLTLARSGMKGRLAKEIDDVYTALRRVLTNIYAVIDFPDEDLSEMSRDEIREALTLSLRNLSRLKESYKTAHAVKEGIPTVIVGRTNVGKSSVYNRIVGYDAAIVTDIEGTTRDILRESASLGKVSLLLSDTAGLRDTEDTVENIGIEKALGEMMRAELILAVFDASKEISEEDISTLKKALLAKATVIALLNKSDKERSFDTSAVSELCEHTVSVSAKTGEGFDTLSALVEKLFCDGDIDIENDAILTGARQYAAVCSAHDAIVSSLDALRCGLPLDLSSVGIESALSALGEVDGRAIGEEIVSEIFSHFCVGK